MNAFTQLVSCCDKPMKHAKQKHACLEDWNWSKLIKILPVIKYDFETLTEFWIRWSKACWRLWPYSKGTKDALPNIKNQIVT